MAEYEFYRHSAYNECNLPLYKALLSNAHSFHTVIDTTNPPREKTLLVACYRMNVEKSYMHTCQWSDKLSNEAWFIHSLDLLSQSDVLRVECSNEEAELIRNLATTRIIEQHPKQISLLLKVKSTDIKELSRVLLRVKCVTYFRNRRVIASKTISDEGDIFEQEDLETLSSMLKGEGSFNNVTIVSSNKSYDRIIYGAMEIMPEKPMESANDYFRQLGIKESRYAEHKDPIIEILHVTGTSEQFFDEFMLEDILTFREDPYSYISKDLPYIVFYDSLSREVAFISDLYGHMTFCVTADMMKTYKKLGFVPEDNLCIRREESYDLDISPSCLESIFV